MTLLHRLINSFRKQSQPKTLSKHSSTRLRVEELEDRVVPSFTTATYTDATVQITPGLTVTETITAKVTPFQGFDMSTGQITPIPTGATAPTSGTVLFNLNNMQQSATLNSSGEATATFKVPLLAFLTSQGLDVQYNGSSDTSGDTWESSFFFASLYKNWDNVLLSGTLTFDQLTPQQVYAQQISAFQNSPTHEPTSFFLAYTAKGEKDTLGNGLVTFNYVDPGTIDSITALGMQLPGIFALKLGAYGGIPASSNSNSSS